MNTFKKKAEPELNPTKIKIMQKWQNGDCKHDK